MAKRGRPRKQYSADELYELYTKEYNRVKSINERKGLEINKTRFEDTKSGKSDLKFIFENYRRELSNKSANEIIKKIVDAQAYSVDKSTAKSMVEYFRLKGEKVTQYNARMRNFTQEQWDMIKDEYEYLHKEGLTASEAKDWISQYVFGSE